MLETLNMRAAITEYLDTSDLPSILKDSTGWLLNPSYGWYKDSVYDGSSSLIDPLIVTISSVREFSFVMSAFHNSPNRSMHNQSIRIGLNDGRYWQCSTTDGWVDDYELIRLGLGYEPVTQVKTADIVNKRYTFITPDNTFITSISISSSRYSGYVSGVRGFNDFKFKFVY